LDKDSVGFQEFFLSAPWHIKDALIQFLFWMSEEKQKLIKERVEIPS
jgi:hypothetical protein